MHLYEYQGKELLAGYSIKVPDGVFLKRGTGEWDISGVDCKEVVLKVQVLEGGRGKRGGVKTVPRGEALKTAREMLKDWDKAVGILVEEKMDVLQEVYISYLIDRKKRAVTLLIIPQGGVEVESRSKNALRLTINPLIGPLPHHIRYASEMTGIGVGELKKITTGMWRAFVEKDLTLLEVNPLALTERGLYVLDAKISFDRSALFRSALPVNNEELAPLEREGARLGLSVVEMKGEVSVMANGAGLTMATMDYLYSKGIRPRLFLDLSGTDDPQKVYKAFKISKKASPRLIFVNVFSGMTKADTVAEGIIKGMSEGASPPVVVRLNGTHWDKGVELLSKTPAHVCGDLPSCVMMIKDILGGR